MMLLLRVIVFLGIAGCGLPLGGTIASAVSSVAELVEKVDARYAQIQDLQADFTQETLFEGFTTGFTSSGRLYLKKPGLLRWDYLQPSEERIYVEGDQVMMYVPEHQQVVKGLLTQIAASKGPLVLLQGVGKLSQQFTIIEPANGVKMQEKLFSLILIPKTVENKVPTLKKIELQLVPETYLIQGITLFEVTGNVSRIKFNNIQVNKGLSTSLFSFEIPPDVVVVELP